MLRTAGQQLMGISYLRPVDEKTLFQLVPFFEKLSRCLQSPENTAATTVGDVVMQLKKIILTIDFGTYVLIAAHLLVPIRNYVSQNRTNSHFQRAELLLSKNKLSKISSSQNKAFVERHIFAVTQLIKFLEETVAWMNSQFPKHPFSKQPIPSIYNKITLDCSPSILKAQGEHYGPFEKQYMGSSQTSDRSMFNVATAFMYELVNEAVSQNSNVSKLEGVVLSSDPICIKAIIMKLSQHIQQSSNNDSKLRSVTKVINSLMECCEIEFIDAFANNGLAKLVEYILPFSFNEGKVLLNPPMICSASSQSQLREYLASWAIISQRCGLKPAKGDSTKNVYGVCCNRLGVNPAFRLVSNDIILFNLNFNQQSNSKKMPFLDTNQGNIVPQLKNTPQILGSVTFKNIDKRIQPPIISSNDSQVSIKLSEQWRKQRNILDPSMEIVSYNRGINEGSIGAPSRQSQLEGPPKKFGSVKNNDTIRSDRVIADLQGPPKKFKGSRVEVDSRVLDELSIRNGESNSVRQIADAIELAGPPKKFKSSRLIQYPQSKNSPENNYFGQIAPSNKHAYLPNSPKPNDGQKNLLANKINSLYSPQSKQFSSYAPGNNVLQSFKQGPMLASNTGNFKSIEFEERMHYQTAGENYLPKQGNQNALIYDSSKYGHKNIKPQQSIISRRSDDEEGKRRLVKDQVLQRSNNLTSSDYYQVSRSCKVQQPNRQAVTRRVQGTPPQSIYFADKQGRNEFEDSFNSPNSQKSRQNSRSRETLRKDSSVKSLKMQHKSFRKDNSVVSVNSEEFSVISNNYNAFESQISRGQLTHQNIGFNKQGEVPERKQLRMNLEGQSSIQDSFAGPESRSEVTDYGKPQGRDNLPQTLIKPRFGFAIRNPILPQEFINYNNKINEESSLSSINGNNHRNDQTKQQFDSIYSQQSSLEGFKSNQKLRNTAGEYRSKQFEPKVLLRSQPPRKHNQLKDNQRKSQKVNMETKRLSIAAQNLFKEAKQANDYPEDKFAYDPLSFPVDREAIARLRALEQQLEELNQRKAELANQTQRKDREIRKTQKEIITNDADALIRDIQIMQAFIRTSPRNSELGNQLYS